ncbi:MAG: DUF4145 domain-containing protein [Alphaproteobacteria bacterium]
MVKIPTVNNIDKEKIMNNQEYIAPSPKLSSYNCPHCNIRAQIDRYNIFKCSEDQINNIKSSGTNNVLTAQKCHVCDNTILWHGEIMLLPDNSSTAPPATSDMPDDVKKFYNEARSIVNKSPAGACALLRLSLQHLLPHIGGKGKTINDGIKDLVKKGLNDDTIQESLDYCRIIGNEAVHPGQIDFQDKPDIAYQIFDCLNFIVEEMISRKNKIKSITKNLPDNKKQAIKQRDSLS